MINVGDKIKNYTVTAPIGEGGMGCVVKVFNEDDKKFYALKYCKETDEKSITRFKREVKIALETTHQNIVEVLTSDLDNIPPFFVMPIAKGSVHDAIPNIRGDFEKVLRIFEQICKGVSALHNSGKFHRDIKPRNALIYDDGLIAVSDFGLSKLEIRESTTHTSSNDFLGTYGYHAPEQFEAKNSDARTDVFQLGKSFYEMYTGDYPYLINSKKTPPGLAYIIQKATAPDPDDRYQSVSDLLQAIKSYEKSLNPKLHPKDALENKILEINKLLSDGFYKEELCIELIDLLGNNKNNTKLFIEFFDRIPNQILKVLANQLHERFDPLIKEYTGQLQTYFKENHINFEYAETVASKMSAIFKSTKNPTLKGLAIKNILRAAIWCNRYNAMDTFNQLLQEVKTNDDATIIAQILEEELELFSHIADQSADNVLHPTIDEVKIKALAFREAETERQRRENEEFMKNIVDW